VGGVGVEEDDPPRRFSCLSHLILSDRPPPKPSGQARIRRSPPMLSAAVDAILTRMADRNVLGGELEPCGTDPLTGFYRDGCCHTGPDDLGSHTICSVVTAEFLAHQRRIGNDLMTPMLQYHFPGLVSRGRLCYSASTYLSAHHDRCTAVVVHQT